MMMMMVVALMMAYYMQQQSSMHSQAVGGVRVKAGHKRDGFDDFADFMWG